MYVCIRVGHKTSPCTETFNDLLCLNPRIKWSAVQKHLANSDVEGDGSYRSNPCNFARSPRVRLYENKNHAVQVQTP
jgi:hypothetical protein